jgi:hypothetical protein
MSEADIALRLEIGLEDDAESVDLQDESLGLRRELLELDVQAVGRPGGEAAPPGTRAVEALVFGTLLVHAGREAIGSVMHAVEGWVSRRAGRSIKITLDGDTIELTNVADDVRGQLVDAFLARHPSGSS